MEPPPPPDISHVGRKWLDLPYATLSAAQQLDIYLPNEGTGPFPVVFYVHGGGFAMGDKRDGMLAPSLVGLERGYAVVSINYRMSGEAVFPGGREGCEGGASLDQGACRRLLPRPGPHRGVRRFGGRPPGGDARRVRGSSAVHRAGLRQHWTKRTTCRLWSTGSGRPTSSPWMASWPKAACGRATTAPSYRPSRSIWARRSPRCPTWSRPPTPSRM